jgi:hypothetical protein
VSISMDVPDVYRGRFERATAGVEAEHRVVIVWLGTNRETKLNTLRISGPPGAVDAARDALNKVSIQGALRGPPGARE